MIKALATLLEFAAASALVQSEKVEQPAAACQSGVVPALTAVKIRVAEDVGSSISKPGQLFRIELVEPITILDCVAVPSGTPGMAEVIDAAPGKKQTLLGAGAVGATFVGSARYLDFDGRRIPLRSMHLALNGGYKEIYAVVGTVPFERGESGPSKIIVPKGSIYDAKTAQAFDVAAASNRASSPQTGNLVP